MIDIIKVELFRLKKSKAYWILLGLAAVCPLFLIFTNAALYMLVGSIDGGFDGSILNVLRNANFTAAMLQYMTSAASDITLLATIATAIVLGKEFSDGTMRNVVLANKSRAALYFGYLITALIVAASYLVAFFTVTLVIVAPIFGFGGMGAGKAVTACMCSFALGLLAVTFMEACVCMFVFGARKQWAAILFPLLIWFLVPQAFRLVAEILSMAKSAFGETLTMDTLRWLPFVNMDYFDVSSIDGALVGINILYLAIFITVFTVSGYYTFKKADLK